MDKLSANQAKTQFGDLLLNVQRQPVEISKNGKPVAVVMSMADFKELDEAKLELLKWRTKQAKQQQAEQATLDGEQVFETLLG